MLPAPMSMEFDNVHAAAVDCKNAATPPAACIVPTPGNTVPNADIAIGIKF